MIYGRSSLIDALLSDTSQEPASPRHQTKNASEINATPADRRGAMGDLLSQVDWAGLILQTSMLRAFLPCLARHDAASWMVSLPTSTFHAVRWMVLLVRSTVTAIYLHRALRDLRRE
jgi:hypothetical protein